MKEVCELVGITKLNTTVYHPACKGMVEQLNRTLKATLRKNAAKFGAHGINSSLECSGHTETPHMTQFKESRPSYCLEWNYVLLWIVARSVS